MRIMTYNLQHCLDYMRKVIDFDVMADAIKSYDADIVGLNEMRGKGVDPEYEEQVKILAEKCGYNYYFFAEAIKFSGCNPYGNGILSKLPIINAEIVHIPDPDPKTGTGYYEHRCLLKAQLEGGYTVLVTHFGLNTDEHENAVKTIIENIAHEKCILMGDFNITPDNELLKPIKNKMCDAADMLEAPLLSWPSDEPRMKIDYIFVSPDLKVKFADIPANTTSDHRPHIAEI